MSKRPIPPSPSGQRGVATVFITMVLMLAVGLIALYTSRSAVVEQRLSASEVRAKQALAAANAGIDHALAYMRNGSLDQDKNDVVDTIAAYTLTSGGGTPSYYRVVYVASTSALPACPAKRGDAWAGLTPPANMIEVAAVACGWSDDDSSVQRIVQRLSGTPATGGAISTPLVTRGAADLLTGGASVLNYFNDLTVWSGGSLLGQSMTGKTFVRDVVAYPNVDPSFKYRDTGISPGCLNPPAGYACSTYGPVLGHDTVGGDTNLSSLSVEGFFQYFMGFERSHYRESIATWVVDANGTLPTENSTDVGSIVNMRDNVIWIEGNLSLPGNIGTPTHPVVLVVNGNLEMNGNAEINGLVFVTGNISGTGTVTIFGALISSGTAAVTGNLKIVFDPSTLSAVNTLGKAAKVSGGWRDW